MSNRSLQPSFCGNLHKTPVSRVLLVYRSKQQRLGTSERSKLQVQAALLDPPPFDPSKLTVRYLPCLPNPTSLTPKRRYTLTHNDVTGSLQLSIGANYNRDQLSGWYTRILRDEVLAEWHLQSADGAIGDAVLHVYCHVSGEEMWPAPPSLRSFIFQREMTLVLDTILYADRELLASDPRLADAPIYVHFRSDLDSLNRIMEWGTLGDKDSWQKAAPGGVFKQLVIGLFPSLDDSDNGSTSSMDQPQPEIETGTAVSVTSSADDEDVSTVQEGAPAKAASTAKRFSNNGTSNGSSSSSSSIINGNGMRAPPRTIDQNGWGARSSSSDLEGLQVLQPVEAVLDNNGQR